MHSRIFYSFKCDVHFDAWWQHLHILWIWMKSPVTNGSFWYSGVGKTAYYGCQTGQIWSTFIYFRKDSFLTQTFMGTWCPSKTSRIGTSCLSACTIFDTSRILRICEAALKIEAEFLRFGVEIVTVKGEINLKSPQIADWFPTARHMHIGKKTNNPPPPKTWALIKLVTLMSHS